MSTLLLVGAGNMGFAMLKGWAGTLQYDLAVVEPDERLRARSAALGVNTYAAPEELPKGFRIDVLVIATKPQVVGDIAARYAQMQSFDALVISIAAGVRLARISAHLGNSAALVRAMPNTPASIGEGMIVCCANQKGQHPEHVETAKMLLSAVGRVAFVEDETLMDAVTAVSGSGPAYVFHFIEALATAAVRAGLEGDLALLLAKQTVFGAARLALDSQDPPARLREQVTSPNGTTAAALRVLAADEGGLATLLTAAVEAARNRSQEFGSI